MTLRGKKAGTREYAVGYGKPPLHTRFRKGQSGNPGGRPRGMTGGKATALALKEAYRLVTVREGDKVITLPAIQAILRSQIALAAKGNGPAQRAIIEAVQAIEREIAEQAAAATKHQESTTPAMSDLEVARRIAFLLAKGASAGEVVQSGSASGLPAQDQPGANSEEK
jgi:histone H3/H4